MKKLFAMTVAVLLLFSVLLVMIWQKLHDLISRSSRK